MLGDREVDYFHGVWSSLTFQISDPAPLILDCQPERHRRVCCIWFVRPLAFHHLSQSLSKSIQCFENNLWQTDERDKKQRQRILICASAISKTNKIRKQYRQLEHLQTTESKSNEPNRT